jgi:hypothetical protein
MFDKAFESGIPSFAIDTTYEEPSAIARMIRLAIDLPADEAGA